MAEKSSIPRKSEQSPLRGKTPEPKTGRSQPRVSGKQKPTARSQLMRLALRACLIARDATFNIQVY